MLEGGANWSACGNHYGGYNVILGNWRGPPRGREGEDVAESKTDSGVEVQGDGTATASVVTKYILIKIPLLVINSELVDLCVSGRSGPEWWPAD